MIKFILRNYKELGVFKCISISFKIYLASIRLELNPSELRGVYLALERMLLKKYDS